jgi:hypothetical protein
VEVMTRFNRSIKVYELGGKINMRGQA